MALGLDPALVGAVGLVGHSGSGKTTLLEALIPLAIARGLQVRALKQSHHRLTWEPPQKDSARLRRAGAMEVMVSSPHGWSLTREHVEPEAWTLPALLARMAPAELTLIEGFKLADIPKVEVHRVALGKAPLHPSLPGVVAMASSPTVGVGLPEFPLEAPEALLDFLLAEVLGR